MLLASGCRETSEVCYIRRLARVSSQSTPARPLTRGLVRYIFPDTYRFYSFYVKLDSDFILAECEDGLEIFSSAFRSLINRENVIFKCEKY